MLYLARRLGELPEIRSDPVTDEPINLNSFDPRLQNLQSPNINEIRSNVLENLLPMPRQFIDPIEICEFKHDNKLELSRFRNNIESFVVGSAANGDSEIRASNFILENQDIIEELTNSMKSRGWKNISYGDIICYAGLISGIIGGLKTNNAYGAIGWIIWSNYQVCAR